jgi:hypothetical protein
LGGDPVPALLPFPRVEPSSPQSVFGNCRGESLIPKYDWKPCHNLKPDPELASFGGLLPFLPARVEGQPDHQRSDPFGHY